MGPLDVQLDFGGPGAGDVVAWEGASAGLIDDVEAGRGGEAKLGVEGGQVGDDVGVVEGVDDGDGLAGAVADGVAKLDVVDAIGMSNLGGGEGGGVQFLRHGLWRSRLGADT